MSEKIDSTLRAVAELKSGLGLFSKELEKIQTQLEELKAILNSQSVEEKKPPIVTSAAKTKKPPVVIRREDQEEVEVLSSPSYQIQVVGLGVQKIE